MEKEKSELELELRPGHNVSLAVKGAFLSWALPCLAKRSIPCPTVAAASPSACLSLALPR